MKIIDLQPCRLKGFFFFLSNERFTRHFSSIALFIRHEILILKI